jgi:hypothetical protein
VILLDILESLSCLCFDPPRFNLAVWVETLRVLPTFRRDGFTCMTVQSVKVFSQSLELYSRG